MKMVLAVYDLFTWGPTFNIFEFLTSAKLFAEKKGAARIDFCLIKRSFRMGAAIQPQDIGAYEFRISDIVLAALPMFPILHSYILDDEQFNGLGLASKYDFVFPLDFSISLTENKAADELRYVRELTTENHLSSATFPSIIVPRFAYEVVRRIKPDAAKNLITITLRGATFQKAKNSDRFVWSQVAEYFRSAGYDVITIPDVESVTEINGAADPLGMLAMANQSYRFATYDAACLNLCVNNGANASLWYNGNARMLVAKMFTPGTNSEESVSFKSSGVDPRKGALTKSPWHDFIFNAEDKGGIIEHATQIFERIKGIERQLEFEVGRGVPYLYLDPWGKLDGTMECFQDPDFFRSAEHPEEKVQRAISILKSSKSIFGSVKSLIIRSILKFKSGDYSESFSLARQSILRDGRYADGYFICAIICDMRKEDVRRDLYLRSARGLMAYFCVAEERKKKWVLITRNM